MERSDIPVLSGLAMKINDLRKIYPKVILLNYLRNET